MMGSCVGGYGRLSGWLGNKGTCGEEAAPRCLAPPAEGWGGTADTGSVTGV